MINPHLALYKLSPKLESVLEVTKTFAIMRLE